MTDLVQRLRKDCGIGVSHPHFANIASDLIEAADLIEAQAKRIAELEEHPFQLNMYERSYNNGFAKAISMAANVALQPALRRNDQQQIAATFCASIATAIKALKPPQEEK